MNIREKAVKAMEAEDERQAEQCRRDAEWREQHSRRELLDYLAPALDVPREQLEPQRDATGTLFVMYDGLRFELYASGDFHREPQVVWPYPCQCCSYSKTFRTLVDLGRRLKEYEEQRPTLDMGCGARDWEKKQLEDAISYMDTYMPPPTVEERLLKAIREFIYANTPVREEEL